MLLFGKYPLNSGLESIANVEDSHKDTACRHQTKINRYFTGAPREYRENPAAGPSVVIRERALIEDDIPLRYSTSSSDVEENEDPYLSSPVVWSGSGIDAAYKRLAN